MTEPRYVTILNLTIIMSTVGLLSVSILLTVQPGIDLWVPTAQFMLSSLALLSLFLHAVQRGEMAYSPVLWPVLGLTVWAGCSFFLPSTISPPVMPS